MTLIAKLITATRLAARGDFRVVRRQLKINTAQWRLARHGRRPFVHHDPGFPFVCHPDWSDSVDQFCNNSGDHWEFHLLQEWLERGDWVIDVGASLGLYSFAIAQAVGTPGKVIAIEASPFVFQKLAESAALLHAPQVTTVHAAVSNASGTITFYVRKGNTYTSEQSLRPPVGQQAELVGVEVPATTLEQIRRDFLEHRTPSLVKIDIEGAEAAALGAAPTEWFGPDGPFWLLEIHPGALLRFGATPLQIIDRFPPLHFDRWLLAKHPLKPLTTTSVIALADAGSAAAIDFEGSLYYNFFAAPKGDRWKGRRERLGKFFSTQEP